MNGQVNEAGTYNIDKVYTSGQFAGLEFYIVSAEVPTDANYFFSEFTYTSNINQTGNGRLGAAFVVNNQLQGPE